MPNWIQLAREALIGRHRLRFGSNFTVNKVKDDLHVGSVYEIDYTPPATTQHARHLGVFNTLPLVQSSFPTAVFGDTAYVSNSNGVVNGVLNVPAHIRFNGSQWVLVAFANYGENVATITTSYTVGINDGTVLLNNGATAITLTLPSATLNPRRKVTLSRMAGSSGAVTLTSAGGNVQSLTVGTMGASTTLGTIGTYTGRATFQSSGTAWHFVG